MPWRRLWTKFKVNWTHHWMRKNHNVKFWTQLQDNSATICILWVHFITNLLQCSILKRKQILFFAKTNKQFSSSLLLTTAARQKQKNPPFFIGKTNFPSILMCAIFKDLCFYLYKKLQNSLTLLSSQVGMILSSWKKELYLYYFSFLLVQCSTSWNVPNIMSTSISVSFQ